MIDAMMNHHLTKVSVGCAATEDPEMALNCSCGWEANSIDDWEPGGPGEPALCAAIIRQLADHFWQAGFDYAANNLHCTRSHDD